VKKIILQRFIHDKVTFGKLLLDWIPDHKDIYTIELPWNNNENGISCIPQGLYNLRVHNSAAHPNTFELLNVPNRTSILIHEGNFASFVNLSSGMHKPDTEGCILVGLGIEEATPMITKSKLALQYLRDVIGQDNCSIEIKD
jgi:hypothetical protein